MNKRLQRKHKQSRSNKTIAEVSKSTTIENKLSHASLMLSYDFEYGVDLQNRVIKLTGEVDDFMWEILDSGLNQLEAISKAKITIRINSEGGSTYHALAIVGRIKKSPAYIVTEAFGQVMSAATLILAAGRSRAISHYSFFMWHEASYDVGGRHSQIKHTVAQVEKEEKMWAEWMSKMTGELKSAKWWYENGVGKDAYFTAEELLNLGVVDEIYNGELD